MAQLNQGPPNQGNQFNNQGGNNGQPVIQNFGNAQQPQQIPPIPGIPVNLGGGGGNANQFNPTDFGIPAGLGGNGGGILLMKCN